MVLNEIYYWTSFRINWNKSVIHRYNQCVALSCVIILTWYTYHKNIIILTHTYTYYKSEIIYIFNFRFTVCNFYYEIIILMKFEFIRAKD